jgi:hypothetical protein
LEERLTSEAQVDHKLPTAPNSKPDEDDAAGASPTDTNAADTNAADTNTGNTSPGNNNPADDKPPTDDSQASQGNVTTAVSNGSSDNEAQTQGNTSATTGNQTESVSLPSSSTGPDDTSGNPSNSSIQATQPGTGNDSQISAEESADAAGAGPVAGESNDYITGHPHLQQTQQSDPSHGTSATGEASTTGAGSGAWNSGNSNASQPPYGHSFTNSFQASNVNHGPNVYVNVNVPTPQPAADPAPAPTVSEPAGGSQEPYQGTQSQNSTSDPDQKPNGPGFAAGAVIGVAVGAATVGTLALASQSSDSLSQEQPDSPSAGHEPIHGYDDGVSPSGDAPPHSVHTSSDGETDIDSHINAMDDHGQAFGDSVSSPGGGYGDNVYPFEEDNIPPYSSFDEDHGQFGASVDNYNNGDVDPAYGQYAEEYDQQTQDFGQGPYEGEFESESQNANFDFYESAPEDEGEAATQFGDNAYGQTNDWEHGDEAGQGSFEPDDAQYWSNEQESPDDNSNFEGWDDQVNDSEPQSPSDTNTGDGDPYAFAEENAFDAFGGDTEQSGEQEDDGEGGDFYDGDGQESPQAYGWEEDGEEPFDDPAEDLSTDHGHQIGMEEEEEVDYINGSTVEEGIDDNNGEHTYSDVDEDRQDDDNYQNDQGGQDFSQSDNESQSSGEQEDNEDRDYEGRSDDEYEGYDGQGDAGADDDDERLCDGSAWD